MATEVTYNGVRMHNVLTRRWEQEIAYDTSRTDAIGQKYTLQFDGVLHAQRVPVYNSPAYIEADIAGDQFSGLERVRHLLGIPRKDLVVKVGGQTVIDIKPVSGGTVNGLTTDIENGPKPISISVTPVGSELFRVSFTIEATVGNCNAERYGENLVVSNRWSIKEVMDQNFHTTRIISGHLRVAASVFAVAKGWPAHMHKPIVIPPLEDSFRRSRVSFGVEEDGLSCSYEIVDTQVHTASPWPATSMEATYSESVTSGVFFTSEMSVRLQGHPGVDKRLLIERALQILDNRLALSEIPEEYLSTIESLSFTEHIGTRCAIDMSARVKRVEALADKLKFGAHMEKMGTPLTLPAMTNTGGNIEGTEYNNQLSMLPKPYGFKHNSPEVDRERRPVVLFFLHCYLQNPCASEHSIGPLTPNETPLDYDNPDREEETAGTEQDYTPETDPRTNYSQETADGIYTQAKMTSRYNVNRMFVGMPIAQTSGTGATSSILQLAGDQNYRYIEVDFERVGSEPNIPNPLHTYTYLSVNATLVHFDVDILPPIRSVDGSQQVHRALARYVYLLDRAPDFTKGVPIGINPVTNFVGNDGTAKLGFDASVNAGTPTNNNS